MIITKRKAVSVGEMLSEEFMEPLAVTQAQLAEAMDVSRRMVNEICNNKRSVTVDTAFILSKVLGSKPYFWLNVQRRMRFGQICTHPSEWPGFKEPCQYMSSASIDGIFLSYKRMESWDAIMTINLKSCFFIAQASWQEVRIVLI